MREDVERLAQPQGSRYEEGKKGDDGNTRERRGLRLEMTQWRSHKFLQEAHQTLDPENAGRNVRAEQYSLPSDFHQKGRPEPWNI